MLNRVFLLSAVSILLSFAPPAFAQVPDPVTTALAPVPGVGHHYIGIGAETVNPADGSICFELPVQTPPGRQLSFSFGINFCSSQLFYLNNYLGQLQWAVPPAPLFQLNGWSYEFPSVTGVTAVTQSRPDPSGHGTNYCDGSTNVVFRGFQGVQSVVLEGSTLNQWPYNSGSVAEIVGENSHCRE